MLALPASGSPTVYKLDFGVPGSPVAEGFAAGELKPLEESREPSFSLVDEKGENPITLLFGGSLGAFGLAEGANPVTTDGIYTFGASVEETTEVPFAFEGLPPGARVALHAIKAHDGDGRAGFLAFGDSGPIDLAGRGDPLGEVPDLSDFVLVGKTVAGADGVARGIFSNGDGATARAEGQWGGLILLVEKP